MPEEQEKNNSKNKLEFNSHGSEPDHRDHPPRSFHLDPRPKTEDKKPEDKKPVKEQDAEKLILQDDKDESPAQPIKHTDNFDKALKEMASVKPPKPAVIGSKPNLVIFLFETVFRLGLAGLFAVIAAAAYMLPLEFKEMIEHNPLTGLVSNDDYLMGGIAAISGVLAVFVLIGWHKRGFLAFSGLWLMVVAYFIAYPIFLS